MVCFAKKFYFKKKNYFSLNQIDSGPVSDRIKPNQKTKKKKKDSSRTHVQPHQQTHGASMCVDRACCCVNGCTASPCMSDAHVPPLKAHLCFPI